MLKTFKSKVLAVAAVAAASATSAMADPVTVDLGDAQTSITNAGTAMIGIAVAILGFMLVIRFLKRG